MKAVVLLTGSLHHSIFSHQIFRLLHLQSLLVFIVSLHSSSSFTIYKTSTQLYEAVRRCLFELYEARLPPWNPSTHRFFNFELVVTFNSSVPAVRRRPPEEENIKFSDSRHFRFWDVRNPPSHRAVRSLSSTFQDFDSAVRSCTKSSHRAVRSSSSTLQDFDSVVRSCTKSSHRAVRSSSSFIESYNSVSDWVVVVIHLLQKPPINISLIVEPAAPVIPKANHREHRIGHHHPPNLESCSGHNVNHPYRRGVAARRRPPECLEFILHFS